MGLLIERRRRAGLVVLLVAAVCAVMGLTGTQARAATHITLTEEDYFSTSNQVGALTAYNAAFEHAHPGVTIKRIAVPFADLDSTLLTQAGSHDLPNILASDNPFVAAMVATGQILPLNKFKGFSTKGYYPAVIDEGLIGGKNYSLPVAGENSIALIYNIADFKAAGITSPPKTWAQLETDAKLLTTHGGAGNGGVSGFGITCDNAEDATWQWEPFFWGDGGKYTFSNISGTSGQQALSLYQTLLAPGGGGYDDGCSGYAQTPGETDDFIAGKLAMMLNGPWNFPSFAGNTPPENYGQYYGVAPIPTESASQKAVVPLGGEDWEISKSGSKQAQQLAFDYIEGMQSPSEELNLAEQFGYLPARISVAKEFVKAAGPAWGVLATQTLYAHPRTYGLGTKYNTISTAVWDAISAVSANPTSSEVSSALSTAQSAITAALG
ncbi:MAG: extracellular solute-binding protein [Solirubrobacteraceae bacterium]